MLVIGESICQTQPVMKMDLKVKVLTLNCWGIVGISRHRKERMTAIAAHIAESNYDFVFLQEVWSKEDFKMISKKASAVLPYSHYFYRYQAPYSGLKVTGKENSKIFRLQPGVIGSGVCILSRNCIVDTAQYQYSLNGFAHKFLHGDWFGGKVVGLCKVVHHGLKINLYVTHLHAEYDPLHDQYLPHRVVQAFEFSQFVKLTSDSADLSIVAGDFNTESTHLPYQMIVHNIGCVDSFLSSPKFKETNAVCTTCGHPDNLYTTRQELRDCPTGKRIDYIMYKYGAGSSVKCLSCETSLGKIPNTALPYSDHEAVISELHVYKSATELLSEADPHATMEAINGSMDILSKSIKDLGINRLLYIIASSLLLIVLLVTMVVQLPWMYDILVEVIQVICAIGLTFCIWMATVMHSIEYNALFNSCKSMEIIINCLIREHGFKLPIKPLDSTPRCEVSNTNSI